MQLCGIIYCSLTALHFSSHIIAYHQEYRNCIYNVWYYSRMSWPIGVIGVFELHLTYDTVNNTRSCKYSLDASDDER
jgi:hypothetical protein